MKFCLFGADKISLPWAEKIQAVLVRKRIGVIYKFERATVSNKGVASIDDGKNLLSSVDAVIITCNIPTGEVNYLIASAVSNNKPLLCFVSDNNGIPEALQTFLKDYRNFGKTILDIHTFSYSDFEDNLNVFIDKIVDIILTERPRIKFTLRITPAIDKYLSEKSAETGLSKADFVRDLIFKEKKD